MDRPVALVLLLTLVLTGCARPPGASGPVPFDALEGEEPVARGSLPPVPAVDGPLAIQIVYPPAGTDLEITDSSFVLGSVGSGRASLTINGQPVPVWPNGAFLGWIAFPGGNDLTLELTVRKGAESARLRHPLRRARGLQASGRRVVGRYHLVSTCGTGLVASQRAAPFRVRASEGAVLRLLLPGAGPVPLVAVAGWDEVPAGIRAFDRDTVNLVRAPVSTSYGGALTGVALGPALGAMLSGNTAAGRGGPAVLEVARGRDTLRVAWPLRLSLLDTGEWVELDDDPERTGLTDAITPGRATPGGTYHWFFPAGTQALATARMNDQLRLRLSSASDAWVSTAEASRLRQGAAPGPATLGPLTATPLGDRVTVRIPCRIARPSGSRSGRTEW
jgi:N-acetylmuramoyl-L-alanine amidase